MKHRGITLLEILIVLVIIASMALVSAPTMKGFLQKSQLKAAVREFTGVARYARQAAILRNTTTEIWIDFDKDTYQLRVDPLKNTNYRVRNQKRSDTMGQLRQLNEGSRKLFFRTVETAAAKDKDRFLKIRFFKNGSATPATIVIANATQKGEMTIEITGATGTVRTYPGPPREPEAVPTAEALTRGTRP